jgi:hypothetical protein
MTFNTYSMSYPTYSMIFAKQSFVYTYYSSKKDSQNLNMQHYATAWPLIRYYMHVSGARHLFFMTAGALYDELPNGTI